MFRRIAIVAVLALVGAVNLSAQNGNCANSTLINNLGSVGPFTFTVFSMGGPGSLLNINLATILGPVGMAGPGTIQESAPSNINGLITVGSTVNTAGVHGWNSGIVVDDTVVGQAVSDANAAASYFASLPSTPAAQAQFPSNGQILQDLTVTGTVGLNVVNLSNFRLDNHATLTLTGPVGTAFVINDSGSFNLHTGNIAVSDGVLPMDVVYNITNPRAAVTTMVPTTAVGILLAPNNNINSMDSNSYRGEIIGGYSKTIVLMSGSTVTNPCFQIGPS
jgi:hypothetical protein